MSGHWAKDCTLSQKKPNENNEDVCKGHVRYTTVESIPTGEIITADAFLVNQHPATCCSIKVLLTLSSVPLLQPSMV
jgi:hypothetical protein